MTSLEELYGANVTVGEGIFTGLSDSMKDGYLDIEALMNLLRDNATPAVTELTDTSATLTETLTGDAGTTAAVSNVIDMLDDLGDSLIGARGLVDQLDGGTDATRAITAAILQLQDISTSAGTAIGALSLGLSQPGSSIFADILKQLGFQTIFLGALVNNWGPSQIIGKVEGGIMTRMGILGKEFASGTVTAGGFVGSGYATGGIATGPTSGYPVTMHGTEAIIPLGDGNRISAVFNDGGLAMTIRELRAEIAALRQEQQRQHHETARYARESSETLKKIDTIGLGTREAA